MLIEFGLIVILAKDVRAVQDKISYFCNVLNCIKPVTLAIYPDEEMIGYGAYTTRIVNSPGCSIHLRAEGINRIDWIAHEACHCANDYEAITPYGWRKNVSDVERKYREDKATKCSQELVEKYLHAN